MNINEFEKKWCDKIGEDILNIFPDSFISNKNFKLINLPGKPLLKGTELFGNFEIIDTEGKSILSSDNIDKIKYILYSNRNNPTQIKLLSNDTDLSSTVIEYENHLDLIVKMIKEDFEHQFPNSTKATIVINKIFQLLNLQRY